MPGNPKYIIPLTSLLSDSNSSGGGGDSPPTPSNKTLEEIAAKNKKKGVAKYDFKDVTKLLEEDDATTS